MFRPLHLMAGNILCFRRVSTSVHRYATVKNLKPFSEHFNLAMFVTFYTDQGCMLCYAC
jgi:hypothetical protein